jgi:hypothetical protein
MTAAQFPDPRNGLGQWPSADPIALLPVRLETRFVTTDGQAQGKQLWVRIYPDDCWIDTFESSLSTSELGNAQRYWRSVWCAGGIDVDQRAAWRALVSAHGNGRANFIADTYQPLNSGAPPIKTHPTDVILVITTQTPLTAPEAAAISAYWQAVWLADGDAQKTQAAATILQSAVGAVRSVQLINSYAPGNLTETPLSPLKKSDVGLSVAFVVFPADPPTQTQTWSQAPRVDQFPDCFVVLGFNGGVQTLEAVGGRITLPLYVGPDPQASPAESIHPDDATGDLFVPDRLKWLVDFPSAVAAGMGLKIDLTPGQAATGFDRLLVFGLQLSADAQGGKAALTKLLQHHALGRSGFELLRQGTPAHNTTGNSSGYGRYDDADSSFDDRKNAPLFTATDDPLKKCDGQWVAEALGIDPASLQKVHGADGLDQSQLRAMQRALWPATLGFWMDKLMSPVFPDDTVSSARWFFTQYVGGRGAVPAIRIGGQPYGILPTTAFSRISWLDGSTAAGATFSPAQRTFLAQLYALWKLIDADWSTMSQSASYVGKSGDAHQILLDIVGLHPASVEFHARYSEGLTALYNIVNLGGLGPAFWQTIQTEGLQTPALQLLGRLGYTGSQIPEIVQQFFAADAAEVGTVIDDRPLSETAPIRAYTDDGRNYLDWLLDAAKSSLDALRQEQGFSANQTPRTLLYLYMRHALMLGYFDTSYQLHKSAGILSAGELAAMKPEPPFVHMDESTQSESRFAALYKTEPLITGSPSVLIGDYITANYTTLPAAAEFADQLDALATLQRVPTAALERLFAEHVDCCCYRFDSWLLGLVSSQLSAMRSTNRTKEGPPGAYLGAYGWLEDVRPSQTALTPVDLPADLATVFAAQEPLMEDSANGGYILAPSIPQARTAAVLRSGYLSNASAANPQTLAVNLSSKRVRLALSILEGIRGGQSLGALLGYRFERGLHDDHGLAEVDKFIYPLRKAFPLVADAISTTQTPPDVPIEAIEARNVMDGLKLVSQIHSSGNSLYPFGLTTLPVAIPPESAAINAEVQQLLEANNALADLALAEGVHQAVQGNFDRVGGTLDAYSTGNFPPDPQVVQTPAAGIGLTHRVAVHFRSGLAAPANATPRAVAEPALDAWLAAVCPGLDRIACTVVWTDPITTAVASRVVHLSDLALRPIDILGLVRPDNTQAMAELDDRVLDFVMAADEPRPDARLEIQYLEAPAGLISVFAFSALMRSLKTSITRSRPLRASDALLRSSATPQVDSTAVVDRARISSPLAQLDALRADVAAYVATLGTLLADEIANRDAVVNGIDGFLADASRRLERISRFGLQQAGWGFAMGWKRGAFSDLIAAVAALVTRWTGRLTTYQAKLAAYNALPTGTSDADLFSALRSAETFISAVPAPLPATPAAFLVTVQAKAAAFTTVRDQLNAITSTADPSFSHLLAAVKALLPIAAYDSKPFDVTSFENRAIVMAEDLLRVLQGQLTAIDARRRVTQTQLDAHDNASSAAAQTQALQAAAKALFGDDFTVYPEFPLDQAQAGEWTSAYGAWADGSLLKYLTHTAGLDFPVDEWLAGVARIRPALHAWEAVVNLTVGFGVGEPQLTPVQFPFEAGAPWVAMQFPSTYSLVSDRLLYTAYYGPAGFDRTQPQCGMLLDEWSELVPAKDPATDLTLSNAGVTFNYDRPKSEAPQSILLVTPASASLQWLWDDLVGALNETLDLAKKRALEPVNLDQNAYARFLPATVMAATLYGISITTSLAAVNGAFAREQATN